MIAMLRPVWAAGVVSLLAFAVAPLARAGTQARFKVRRRLLKCWRAAVRRLGAGRWPR